MVCGEDIYLPHSELCVKAIKLKDNSFLLLLYAKLLFDLCFIFHISGQCFQSFVSSSSHSLTLKMHLPVCQPAAAITASTHLAPWKGSGGSFGGSLEYPSLKAAHELWVFWLCPRREARGICSSKLWVIWFPFLPPQSLMAAHFSEVMKELTKDVRNREIHMRKSAELQRKSPSPQNSFCFMMFSW